MVPGGSHHDMGRRKLAKIRLLPAPLLHTMFISTDLKESQVTGTGWEGTTLGGLLPWAVCLIGAEQRHINKYVHGGLETMRKYIEITS